MGRFRPFPLVGGSYTDDSLPWAHQETINYLPVKAERSGTRSSAKLAMVPGMPIVADIGEGPYRGSHDVEGKRFVVSGSKLYQISVDDVATLIGTIPGTGRVCMAHNQITNGNQLVIGAGSVGYTYNTYTAAFAQITDDAFPGMVACDFLNQRILGVEPLGRYWYHSALVDATDYNALDEYQAETSPDRIVGLIALHNEVLVFGERTIEPWTNDPTENQAFQLQRGSVIESGCASGNTICKLDNSVLYLTENGQIARLNGYVPQIISTYALEGAIKDADWSRAFAFTWEDKGHTVYYITFPEVGTFGYDVRQGEWHRRKSFGMARWRLNTLFKSAGSWYGGDFQNGKLYRLDWSYALDGCEPIERIRSSGYVHKDGERATVNALQVTMDSGAAQSVKHDGVVITGAMPDTFVGSAVSFQYTITTAYPGQDYTLDVTGLPDGLSISGTGLVTGTATIEGTFAIAISAEDDCGNASSHADSVIVAGFTIAGSVSNGVVDGTDSGAYVNTHGSSPITYAVTAGAFPDGLTLATDGTWSGTYTTAGSYSWTVTATDANGNTTTLADTAVVTALADATSTAYLTGDGPFVSGGGDPGIYITEPLGSFGADDPRPTQSAWIRFTVSSGYVNNVRAKFFDSADGLLWDSGWCGDSSLQANQDAAYTTAGRADVNGTIANTEPHSEVLLIAANKMTNAYVNGYNYREISNLSTDAHFDVINLSLLPVGTIALTSHPTAKGYYIAPDGSLYKTSWATT